MQNFSTPTLSFPVGFPVYSVIYSMDSIDNVGSFVSSSYFLDSEYKAMIIIHSEENLISFISYLDNNVRQQGIHKTCNQYKEDHGIDYKTVYSLY